MPDLISKRTRNAFREALVGWTLAEIRTEFDNEGFAADRDHIPEVNGERRGLVEQLYANIDFADSRDAARVLEVFRTVEARLRSDMPADADKLLDHLTRDGVVVEAKGWRLPAKAHAGLTPLANIAEQFTADQLHAQINRIHQAVDSDPALAIGTAKELLETACKTILADLGEQVGTPDVGDLVKAVSKQLKLLPDDVPQQAKGADAIRKTLRSLAATVSGIAEMRNFYGSGHGQDGRARGLTPRHARLAVGAATTLALFLFETHEDRKQEAAAAPQPLAT